MPSDEVDTSYTPGDLYDVLSTIPEVRFHAGHLFLRYVHLVDPPSTVSGDSATEEDLEAVYWDVALACLTISIKFHRDFLYPLNVIYAHEFLCLAPHEVEFEDLESAQRDVLEALGYQVGNATPGAFMAELWLALPPLRRLVGFDEGWERVQEHAWEVLCEAIQQAEVLLYPISLLTAAAVIEGILEALAQRYRKTRVDGRGKPLKKRDAKSLKKAALKASCGVRSDIQDVLRIPDVRPQSALRDDCVLTVIWAHGLSERTAQVSGVART
ncbi:hypothetical protein C8Q70DRAFT_905402 [Cubamyces menziesii]|nr:hypothetical protein C8Q70DRAFT_905402 [Cubamyces menziesii]